MPLPLMLRSTHERLLADAEKRLALAEAEASEAKRLYELERRRFDDLLARQADAQTVAKTNSKATEVIRDAARGPDGRVDPRLVAHLRGQYNRLLREGQDPDDALEAVQQWESTEGKSGATIESMMAAVGGLKG